MPAPKEVTPEMWNHIVDVFAKHEGRVHASAVELGWGTKRAERVFKQGYPSIGYPPVLSLIGRDASSHEEIRAARAALEDEVATESAAELVATNRRVERRSAELDRSEVLTREEQKRMLALVERENIREKARKDAVQSRAEEASLVSASRRNALALNAVTAQVLRGAVKLAAKIQASLEDEADKPTLTLGQQLALVRQASQIARFNAEAGLQAVKSERMVLGQQPGADEDHEPGGSLEEAARWVETSLRALQRAKDRGLIVTAEVVTPGIHGGAVPEVVTPGIHAEELEDEATEEPEREDDEAELEEAVEDDEARPTDPRPPPDPDLVREASRARLPTASEERLRAGVRRLSKGRLRAVLPHVGARDE